MGLAVDSYFLYCKDLKKEEFVNLSVKNYRWVSFDLF